jgi:hypothetical protein
MTENLRRRMAGCGPDDTAATALAEALDICSGGKRFVRNRSTIGASFRPSKGGWVVHNTAWAGWGGMPHFILRTACAVLTGAIPEDVFEERYGVIADAAGRSYAAGRGEFDAVTGVTLDNGDVVQFGGPPRPISQLPQVGERVTFVEMGEVRTVTSHQ